MIEQQLMNFLVACYMHGGSTQATGLHTSYRANSKALTDTPEIYLLATHNTLCLLMTETDNTKQVAEPICMLLCCCAPGSRKPGEAFMYTPGILGIAQCRPAIGGQLPHLLWREHCMRRKRSGRLTGVPKTQERTRRRTRQRWQPRAAPPSSPSVRLRM